MLDLAQSTLAALAVALAYILIGSIGALKSGQPFDKTKALQAIGAAIFLAIVDPSLLPNTPTLGLELIPAALTAFSTFGAMFVTIKVTSFAVSLYEDLKPSLEKLVEHFRITH